MKNQSVTMDKIVSLAKRRGFIYPGSEIYGGLANSWDYGPLGVELKNNLRDWWWQRFVQSRDDMVGLDAAILMNPRAWEASGHVASFADALVDCKKCKTRHRADHLIEDCFPDEKVEGKTLEEFTKIIEAKGITCPECGAKDFTEPRKFNLLFETSIGVTAEKANTVYLRGEIAQSMFVNFKNVINSTRVRLPFGIASIGKAFRNEITPGNFIYRTLEFDLMEFEYFTREEEWEKWFDYWLAEQKTWLKEIGFQDNNVRVREHAKEELSHYSKRTADIEYNTPFGWKEMFGLAYRTDFDLKNHTKQSGVDLSYVDPDTGEKFVPHVVEPTFGLTRLVLMVLLEHYREEGEGKNKRVYLKLPPRLAPYKVAVFPLLANKPDLVKKAREIYLSLVASHLSPITWDARGNIGKRYLSQDEIGTPFCVTIDFDSLEDDSVTIRNRDTKKQERIKLDKLQDYLASKLERSPKNGLA